MKTKVLDWISELCPACGLCCNGGLFGDVELQPREDVNRLGSLGLEFYRKGRKYAFRQPCACFDGKFCGIYAERPARCRTFQCRLLQRTQAGSLTIPAALKSIRAARQQVETMQKLLCGLGNRDETVPLNERYAAVLAQPIDFASDTSIEKRRGQLMRLSGKLAEILERDFLT